MKVKYYYSNQITEGELIYRKYEYSFDFLSNKYGTFVYLIHYLQISVDVINNKFVSVWGLHPDRLWEKTELKVPDFKNGVIECKGDFTEGIGFRLEECNDWLTYVDENNGWVCVGDKDILKDAIMFAENIGVVIVDNELVSLWMKPKMILENK